MQLNTASAWLCKGALLLLLLAVGSASARRFRPAEAAEDSGRGVKFNFEHDGGASAFLTKLDADSPGKLRRIMRRANFRNGTADLAKNLDGDKDLVSKVLQSC